MIFAMVAFAVASVMICHMTCGQECTRLSGMSSDSSRMPLKNGSLAMANMLLVLLPPTVPGVMLAVLLVTVHIVSHFGLVLSRSYNG